MSWPLADSLGCEESTWNFRQNSLSRQIAAGYRLEINLYVSLWSFYNKTQMVRLRLLKAVRHLSKWCPPGWQQQLWKKMPGRSRCWAWVGHFLYFRWNHKTKWRRVETSQEKQLEMVEPEFPRCDQDKRLMQCHGLSSFHTPFYSF